MKTVKYYYEKHESLHFYIAKGLVKLDDKSALSIINDKERAKTNWILNYFNDWSLGIKRFFADEEKQ